MTEVEIDEFKTDWVKELKQLRCSKCGATTDAICECGVGYVPAHEYAAKALAANPEKSDRAIAAELGIDHKTVAKQRKLTGENSPVRIGRDRKARRVPKPKSPKPQPLNIALSALTQIEQLVGDMTSAIGKVRSDVFDSRIRAVIDRLSVLITTIN
jgi:hypothetical protein